MFNLFFDANPCSKTKFVCRQGMVTQPHPYRGSTEMIPLHDELFFTSSKVSNCNLAAHYRSFPHPMRPFAGSDR